MASNERARSRLNGEMGAKSRMPYRQPRLVEMGDLRALTLGTSTGGGWSLPPTRTNLPPGSLVMPDGSVLLPDGKLLPPEK